MATLRKHRHTPLQGLHRHCFARLDPLSPSDQALHSQPHSLLAGFISTALTTASGLAALLACPHPQTSSVLAHLAHCHVPCTLERNDTRKSPVSWRREGVNEGHLASYPPCGALTPKPGRGVVSMAPSRHSLSPTFSKPTLPSCCLSQLPAAPAVGSWVRATSGAFIQAEGSSQLPGPKLRLLRTGSCLVMATSPWCLLTHCREDTITAK